MLWVMTGVSRQANRRSSSWFQGGPYTKAGMESGLVTTPVNEHYGLIPPREPFCWPQVGAYSAATCTDPGT